jgi:hypothetical protein
MARVEQRSDPQQSKAVQVSEQDESIIQAAIRYQYMTMLDFWYELGRSISHTYLRRVLYRLAGGKDQTEGHFLYRFCLPKTTCGEPKRVYVPGMPSYAFLSRAGEALGGRFTTPAAKEGYSYSFLYHNLAVSRLAIVAGLFVREHPTYALAELRLWHELAGSNRPRVRLETDGQVTQTCVIPDLFVFLQRLTDGGGPGIWFEVDNGTTYRVAFLRRLASRLAYLKSADYEREFGTPAVTLCYVVITKDPKRRQARLQSLARWIDDYLDHKFLDQETLDQDESVNQEKKEQWASMFRLIALDYETLYEHTTALFTEKLWYPPGKIAADTKPSLSLLPPLNKTENTHADTTTPTQHHARP